MNFCKNITVRKCTAVKPLVDKSESVWKVKPGSMYKCDFYKHNSYYKLNMPMCKHYDGYNDGHCMNKDAK